MKDILTNGRDAWSDDSKKKMKKINNNKHKISIIRKEKLNRKINDWDLDQLKEEMMEISSLRIHRQWVGKGDKKW